MSLSDPISDMLTRIRNAARAKKSKVDIKRSKLCWGLAQILQREGFIADCKEIDEGPQGSIRVYLKYGPDGEDAIRTIDRVSKPGRRIYQSVSDIAPILNGMGVSIFSTSKGVMTDRECRENNIGGECLARVT